MENRQQISNGACVSGDVQMITPNNTVPQKRGRGRPRKNPVANTTVNSTNTNNIQGGSVPFGSDSSLVHEPGNQLNRTVGSRLNPNLNSNPAPTPYHTPMQHNARYDISSEMPFDEIRDDGSGYECVQDSMDEEQDKEPPLDSGEQQRKKKPQKRKPPAKIKVTKQPLKARTVQSKRVRNVRRSRNGKRASTAAVDAHRSGTNGPNAAVQKCGQMPKCTKCKKNQARIGGLCRKCKYGKCKECEKNLAQTADGLCYQCKYGKCTYGFATRF